MAFTMPREIHSVFLLSLLSQPTEILPTTSLGSQCTIQTECIVTDADTICTLELPISANLTTNPSTPLSLPMTTTASPFSVLKSASVQSLTQRRILLVLVRTEVSSILLITPPASVKWDSLENCKLAKIDRIIFNFLVAKALSAKAEALQQELSASVLLALSEHSANFVSSLNDRANLF